MHASKYMCFRACVCVWVCFGWVVCGGVTFFYIYRFQVAGLELGDHDPIKGQMFGAVKVPYLSKVSGNGTAATPDIMENARKALEKFDLREKKKWLPWMYVLCVYVFRVCMRECACCACFLMYFIGYRKVAEWCLAPSDAREPKEKIARQLALDLEYTPEQAEYIITAPVEEESPTEEFDLGGMYITCSNYPLNRKVSCMFFFNLLIFLYLRSGWRWK